MSDSPTGRSVTLLVLSVYQEMGETFFQAIGLAPGGALTLRNQTVNLHILAGDPRVNPSWDETVKKANLVAILIRFMDIIALDKVKAIYRRLPRESSVPMGFLVLREEGEIDFKMSCPSCGQKLWVRDSDIGKRGRCPNCKRAFKLPSQVSHLRSQLTLPDAVPVLSVVRGNPESCRVVLGNLLDYLGGEIVTTGGAFDPEVLKQTTVRIQVSENETPPPASR